MTFYLPTSDSILDVKKSFSIKYIRVLNECYV